MRSTPLAPLDRASPPAVLRPSPALLLAAALLVSCAKGATRPNAPTDVLHYPAWIAAVGPASLSGLSHDQLLIANLDQDLAYDNGAVVAFDPTIQDGAFLDAVAVPNMAGQVLVVDQAAAGACASALDAVYPLPFALVAGRFQDSLFVVPLSATSGGSLLLGTRHEIPLNPFSASAPFGLAFSCGTDSTPRVWVSFLSGQNSTGYIDQVDLLSDSVVQVNALTGGTRSFAYDPAQDRLYFTNREHDQAAPVRWIQVGTGCLSFPNGVQDERQGGCHVDTGFDLSNQFRGAEPNEIKFASSFLDDHGVEQPFLCTTPGFKGQVCPRLYLSVRIYDADLAAFIGGRPSGDLGGKLVVLELPESGLGRPEPQVVAEFDIGRIAGDVQLIPRTGKRPLVAVTAIDDALLWLYDDDTGSMAKVFGRDALGMPAMGRQPTASAGVDLGGNVTRLFVTSYRDNWLSAVDVPLDDPGGAYVVREGADPTDTRQPIRRWGVTP